MKYFSVGAEANLSNGPQATSLHACALAAGWVGGFDSISILPMHTRCFLGFTADSSIHFRPEFGSPDCTVDSADDVESVLSLLLLDGVLP